LALAASTAFPAPSPATLPPHVQSFIEDNCSDCHDAESKKGGLDLTTLAYQPDDIGNFARWVKIHDRVANGEMPPKKADQPGKGERAGFLTSLSGTLIGFEKGHDRLQGRALERRLNRYEYENSLRDLLQAPWLQVRDSLPEDGEAFRFNKVGEALDVSYVQLARYLSTADTALRQVLPTTSLQPPSRIKRYYARDQKSYTGKMAFSQFNQSPYRATFPMLGYDAQPDVRRGQAPMTVGEANPQQRELESVGVVASAYEPIEPTFNQFRAPVSGHYKLRINGFSVWVGPGQANKWFVPNLDQTSRGRRDEPITVYSQAAHQLRWQGRFDVSPEPTTHELDVWLLAGETIRTDPTRLFRSRPGASPFHNPLAEPDGQPGVAMRWLEVEGPLYDQWPTPAVKLLFGDLAWHKGPKMSSPVDFLAKDPPADARRLIANFETRAYRRPVGPTEVDRFLPIVTGALKSGNSFTDAMLATYTAILSSPEFLTLQAQPGPLDDYALASRLSFFLWNSPPDAELRSLAASGQLHQAAVLHAQTDRLLDDPKSRRFVDAFLDYWLDLRKIMTNTPDSTLYPDYYLDDALTEASVTESQLFFSELVKANLPARNVVASDFVMVNERLAALYQIPGVQGNELRQVALPSGSVRGGFMTQASVLKVTANGTTTSPVVRGAWIMERILGEPPPPPPPSVPSLEPDTRGAVTIRQQLEKHRTLQSCASCHARIDPAGFALESFDVQGGWRDRYRAVAADVKITPPLPGFGHNGQKFAFHEALPVDCSGKLWDGRTFSDVNSLKRLLLSDEPQIARNLTSQLIVFATGAPVRFSDRAAVEQILAAARGDDYGVRTLITALVQSDLFRNK